MTSQAECPLVLEGACKIRHQLYQAVLLKDLDQEQGLSPETAAGLHRTTDLALRATKQTAAAMLVKERCLWLNLSEIKEKDKSFILDTPI